MMIPSTSQSLSVPMGSGAPTRGANPLAPSGAPEATGSPVEALSKPSAKPAADQKGFEQTLGQIEQQEGGNTTGVSGKAQERVSKEALAEKLKELLKKEAEVQGAAQQAQALTGQNLLASRTELGNPQVQAQVLEKLKGMDPSQLQALRAELKGMTKADANAKMAGLSGEGISAADLRSLKLQAVKDEAVPMGQGKAPGRPGSQALSEQTFAPGTLNPAEMEAPSVGGHNTLILPADAEILSSEWAVAANEGAEEDGLPLQTKSGPAKKQMISGHDYLEVLSKAQDKERLKGVGPSEVQAEEGVSGGSSRKFTMGDALNHKDAQILVDPSGNSQSSMALGESVRALQQNNNPAAQQVPRADVTGHVVLGSMAKERLSSESIMTVGSGVKSLSAQGGGEMTIRLKPDNLGELNLKVSTMGNHVGIRVQASDPRSQKIIEESMGGLRDQLALHQLTLTKFDVVASPSNTQLGQESSFDSRQQHSQGHSNHSQIAQNMQDEGQRRSHSWVGDLDENNVGVLARPKPVASSWSPVASASNQNGPARLNVVA